MEERVELTPRTINQARAEALVAFAPKGLPEISGFLAGAVLVWIPIVVFAFTFLYSGFFGGETYLSGSDRWLLSLSKSGSLAARYAATIWPFTFVAGAAGIGLAKLRQFSARHDRYFRLELKDGEVRWGYHLLLCTFVIPLIAVAIILSVNSTILFVSLFGVILSGFIFGSAWTILQDLFVGLAYRPGRDASMGLALRVLLPRELGPQRCRVMDITVDESTRSVKVAAELDSDLARRQARELVQKVMRGYQRVDFE